MPGGGKPKFTVEQAEQSIIATRGNILAASANLKCSRMTLYKKIRNSERLQKVLLAQREEMLDFAEAKLYQQIRNDNITAIIFYLKTQGRSRGYTQRVELDGTENGTPINVSDRRNVTINLVGGTNGGTGIPEIGTDTDNGSGPVSQEHEEPPGGSS